MPKRVVPLTDLQIRSAKPRAKPYKLTDGGGLFVEVTPSGTKLWRLKYRRANGKENKLHLGQYPTMGLAEARLRREEMRHQIANAIDPAAAKRARDAVLQGQAENTFEVVARAWHQACAHYGSSDAFATNHIPTKSQWRSQRTAHTPDQAANNSSHKLDVDNVDREDTVRRKRRRVSFPSFMPV
jgi:hypothetical protein